MEATPKFKFSPDITKPPENLFIYFINNPYIRKVIYLYAAINAKFNKKNVNYQEGLRQAVSQAQAAKPSVHFDVVAVSPVSGSQASKKNAQTHAGAIFQEMVEMGVGADRISLSAKTSGTASGSEVQIFVR